MAIRGGNIRVEGIAFLAGQLDRLKSTAQGADLRQALLDSAEMIRDEAERRAPIASRATQYEKRMIAPGGLKASLKAASGRQYSTFLQAFAFTIKKMAPHANMVEGGTKPHTIKAKGKGMRISAPTAGFTKSAWFAKIVRHPGARKNPFFSDAIRAKRGQIKSLITARVKAAFDALAMRAA